MIIGPCPYCDELMMNPAHPEGLLGFYKISCNDCGRSVWIYSSRLEPLAYTEEDFAKAYYLDEETKTAKKRVS